MFLFTTHSTAWCTPLTSPRFKKNLLVQTETHSQPLKLVLFHHVVSTKARCLNSSQPWQSDAGTRTAPRLQPSDPSGAWTYAALGSRKAERPAQLLTSYPAACTWSLGPEASCASAGFFSSTVTGHQPPS